MTVDDINFDKHLWVWPLQWYKSFYNHHFLGQWQILKYSFNITQYRLKKKIDFWFPWYR